MRSLRIFGLLVLAVRLLGSYMCFRPSTKKPSCSKFLHLFCITMRLNIPYCSILFHVPYWLLKSKKKVFMVNYESNFCIHDQLRVNYLSPWSHTSQASVSMINYESNFCIHNYLWVKYLSPLSRYGMVMSWISINIGRQVNGRIYCSLSKLWYNTNYNMVGRK